MQAAVCLLFCGPAVGAFEERRWKARRRSSQKSLQNNQDRPRHQLLAGVRIRVEGGQSMMRKHGGGGGLGLRVVVREWR